MNVQNHATVVVAVEVVEEAEVVVVDVAATIEPVATQTRPQLEQHDPDLKNTRENSSPGVKQEVATVWVVM